MRAKFRGVFLTSQSPSATAQFYQQVTMLPLERIEVETDYAYWRMDSNGVQFAIHDAKRFADYAYPAVSNSNLTHLYFKIDDQAAFLKHLEALGLRHYAIDDVVVTVVDPDGRKVLFGTA